MEQTVFCFIYELVNTLNLKLENSIERKSLFPRQIKNQKPREQDTVCKEFRKATQNLQTLSPTLHKHLTLNAYSGQPWVFEPLLAAHGNQNNDLPITYLDLAYDLLFYRQAYSINLKDNKRVLIDIKNQKFNFEQLKDLKILWIGVVEIQFQVGAKNPRKRITRNN